MPFALPGQSILTVGGRRVVVGPPPATGPTYADFVAYVNANTAGGALTWGSAVIASQTGAYRTTCAAAAGAMSGSPWGDFFSGQPSRAVQHGLPSQAEFNAQVAQGAIIRFTTTARGSNEVLALNRNGYTSFADPSINCSSMDVLEYWDFATSKAMRMNPSLTTGPVEFTLPGF